MSRVTQAQLERLAEDLSPRRWRLLHAVHQVRLATGGQLCRRFHLEGGPSAARLTRLDLAAMHQANILHRLARRIGGVRAGSTGFIYAVGPVGRRLLEFHAGEGLAYERSRYEPTVGFVDHALAVTEVLVGLHEHLHGPLTGEHDAAIDCRVERTAWRSYLDALGVSATLKPDAEVRIRRGHFEDRWWIEVDRATERRSTIQRKCAAYVAYFHTGQEQQRTQMFPLTAWLTSTEARAEVLREVIDSFAPRDRRLFRVGLLSAASPLLLSHGRSEP